MARLTVEFNCLCLFAAEPGDAKVHVLMPASIDRRAAQLPPPGAGPEGTVSPEILSVHTARIFASPADGGHAICRIIPCTDLPAAEG